MGSVKDLEVLKEPTKECMGVARFHFSDRYSVFDWGEMPDHLKNKGSALCIMGAYCFEKLEELGVKTHYRGVVTSEGKLTSVFELEKPVNVMEINLVRVFKPKFKGKTYDYSVYTELAKRGEGNFLLPLEFVYRNGLPEGSSIFRRIKKGEVTLEALGLNHYPSPGERLKNPIFDVSTKLEEQDRYLTWEEAKEVAGLLDEEVDKIKYYLSKINWLISKAASNIGLENEDGKVEFGFNPKRELIVVDVVGTLDECRFTYKGLHVSKEVARQFYRKTQWYMEVEKAKREAATMGVENWRSLCRLKPPKLDVELKEIIEKMYMAVANEFTGLKLFEVERLIEIMRRYENYVRRMNVDYQR